MKIDLQTHSTYSDGHNSPTELMQICARAGVRLAAVTDHDGTGGLGEAREAARKHDLPFVAGIELTTVWHEKTLHILGYNFDSGNRRLLKLCTHLRDDRRRVFLSKSALINERLKQESRPTIDVDEFVKAAGDFFGLGKFLDYVVKKNIFTDKIEAEKYWRESTRVKPTRLTPKEAIEVLHEAGGIAVLSHPFGPKISLKELIADFESQKNLIKEFRGQGLDGIECYTPSHLDEDVEKALAVAKEFDLIVTGGSDWHGPIAVLGESVRNYIPNYSDSPGVEVPQEVGQKLLDLFVV